MPYLSSLAQRYWTLELNILFPKLSVTLRRFTWCQPIWVLEKLAAPWAPRCLVGCLISSVFWNLDRTGQFDWVNQESDPCPVQVAEITKGKIEPVWTDRIEKIGLNRRPTGHFLCLVFGLIAWLLGFFIGYYERCQQQCRRNQLFGRGDCRPEAGFDPQGG